MPVVARREAESSLAAFTAAKIHAEDLGDPSSAAPLFLRSAGLGLPAGLDEEALARAVEAFAKVAVLAKDRRQHGTVTLAAGHAERTIALFAIGIGLPNLSGRHHGGTGSKNRAMGSGADDGP